jgi:hypothetical protein
MAPPAARRSKRPGLPARAGHHFTRRSPAMWRSKRAGSSAVRAGVDRHHFSDVSWFRKWLLSPASRRRVGMGWSAVAADTPAERDPLVDVELGHAERDHVATSRTRWTPRVVDPVLAVRARPGGAEPAVRHRHGSDRRGPEPRACRSRTSLLASAGIVDVRTRRENVAKRGRTDQAGEAQLEQRRRPGTLLGKAPKRSASRRTHRRRIGLGKRDGERDGETGSCPLRAGRVAEKWPLATGLSTQGPRLLLDLVQGLRLRARSILNA